jgi:hypothetical protein
VDRRDIARDRFLAAHSLQRRRGLDGVDRQGDGTAFD